MIILDTLLFLPQIFWTVCSLWMFNILSHKNAYAESMNFDKWTQVLLGLGAVSIATGIGLNITNPTPYIIKSPLILMAEIGLIALTMGGILLGRNHHAHKTEHPPHLYPWILLHTSALLGLLGSGHMGGKMACLILTALTTRAIIKHCTATTNPPPLQSHRNLSTACVGFMMLGATLLYQTGEPLWWDTIIQHTWLSMQYGHVAFASIIMALVLMMGVAPLHGWVGDILHKTDEENFIYSVLAPRFVAGVILITLSGANSTGANWVSAHPHWGNITSTIALISCMAGCYYTVYAPNFRGVLWGGLVMQNGLFLLILAHYTGQMTIIALSLLSFGTVAFWCCTVFCSLSYRRGKVVDTLSDLSGLCRLHPILSLLLLISLFHLAGIPPTAGFWMKMGVFSSIWETNTIIANLVIVTTIILTAVGYLRVVRAVYFGNARRPLDLCHNMGLFLWAGLCCGLLIVSFLFPHALVLAVQFIIDLLG